MLQTRLRTYVLLCVLLLTFAASAHAGVILTLDQTALTGLAGDLFILSGTVENSDATLTEDFNALNAPILTGGVLSVQAMYAPTTLNVGQSYTGNIAQVQILPSISPGTYPATFTISYESINGRTFNSAPTPLSVTVTPEPMTLALTGLSLLMLGIGRKRSRWDQHK